jgi:hypothetical protein
MTDANNEQYYAVHRNGKPMPLDGGFNGCYTRGTCHHIVEHLKTVSDDTFTVEYAITIPQQRSPLRESAQ